MGIWYAYPDVTTSHLLMFRAHQRANETQLPKVGDRYDSTCVDLRVLARDVQRRLAHHRWRPPAAAVLAGHQQHPRAFGFDGPFEPDRVDADSLLAELLGQAGRKPL